MRSFIFLLLVVAGLTNAAQAEDYPAYLVLRAPVHPTNQHDTHGYYPGRAYAVETQAYNYGWFGAKYGKTKNRQFGYYRDFAQWKVR
jgi:hypothetical protein